MTVDLGIGTIQTTLSAADPEFFKSDAFRMEVQRILREELEQREELKERRAKDMRGLREVK